MTIKKFVYADNYRGFKDTYIPIKKVNFFVGENSAGKTSVLELVRALSDSRIFLEQTGDFENSIFGSYDEMVSAGSPNKSSFTIGHISQTKNKKTTRIRSVIFTFKNDAGKPRISALTFIGRQGMFSFKLGKSTISFKIHDKDIEEINNPENQVIDIFKVAIKEHKSKTKGYKKIDVPNAEIPLVILPMLVNMEEKEEMKFRPNDLVPFAHNLVWLAPIRTNPKRTYDGADMDYSPDGKHTPFILKRQLSKRKTSKSFKENIERFGKESNLFDSLKIKNYGTGSTAPFELKATLGNTDIRINNIGYGVSQSLPIVVEILDGDSSSLLCVQQPEVHLHPKAQAALGDLVFSAAKEAGKDFIIETHSDFMIDRYRVAIRKSKGKLASESQVLFFSRTKNGNKISPIEIKNDGMFGDQPKGYRDFFIKEELEILGL